MAIVSLSQQAADATASLASRVAVDFTQPINRELDTRALDPLANASLYLLEITGNTTKQLREVAGKRGRGPCRSHGLLAFWVELRPRSEIRGRPHQSLQNG